jgi:hypothetical protein
MSEPTKQEPRLPRIFQPQFTEAEFKWLIASSNYVVAEVWQNPVMMGAALLQRHKVLMLVGPANMSDFVKNLNIKMAKMFGSEGQLLDTHGKITSANSAQPTGEKEK